MEICLSRGPAHALMENHPQSYNVMGGNSPFHETPRNYGSCTMGSPDTRSLDERIQISRYVDTRGPWRNDDRNRDPGLGFS